MRMFDQDVPLAGIGERQETQWRNPDHVLARCPHWAKHLAIPAPGAHPRRPLAAPLETDRVPHFPSLRVSQTSCSCSPSNQRAGSAHAAFWGRLPPTRGKEAGSPRMFATARPRGSIWPAGPETAFQGHRSVLCMLFGAAGRQGGWRFGKAEFSLPPKPPSRRRHRVRVPAPGWSPPLVSLRSLVSLGLPWDFLLDAAWSGDPAPERQGLGAQRPSPSRALPPPRPPT